MKPKTVKSFLKMCIEIAYANRDELKGSDKLSEEEYSLLGTIRAGVQNDLGENPELLKKYKLKYDSGND